jgi:hypothetical protein
MEKDPPNPSREKEAHPSSTTTTPISPSNPTANVEPPSHTAQTPPASPPGQPPAGIGSLPPVPPSPTGESHSTWVQRWSDAIPIAIFGLLVVALVKLAIILIKLIYPLPYPTRMYLALSAGAGVLILAGLFFLIILIPAASRFLKSELRTELYSVRASSLCVIAGLIIFGIVAIGLVLAQLMQNAGRP